MYSNPCPGSGEFGKCKYEQDDSWNEIDVYVFGGNSDHRCTKQFIILQALRMTDRHIYL